MAGVLPATLWAASRFKIAPGDFVDHSGTSPSACPLRGPRFYAMAAVLARLVGAGVLLFEALKIAVDHEGINHRHQGDEHDRTD